MEHGDKAYKYFCELCKIPHGSGNEKAISDYMVAFAKEKGLDAVQDKWLNVLIRKPGSKGRENDPAVILQAHMDMVCEKNEDVKHDFLKDPIVPVIDGDWVKTRGTTLGADNGSGVSLIMMALTAENISHPPLEAILTTEEETGCTGAAMFDTSLLKGKRLINLDGAGEDTLIAGCAGGIFIELEVPVERETVPAGFVFYRLMVKGLAGGHSAGDIDKGRGNANVLAAGLLDKLFKEEVRLVDINGGAKMNAIPRECSAVISFAEGKLEKIKSLVAQTETEYKAEYQCEKGLAVTLGKTGASGSVMSNSSQREAIDTILRMPCGVQSMSPDAKGLVQTSNNPGVITGAEDAVTIKNFLRSSSKAEMENVAGKIKTAAESCAAKINILGKFPIWEYNPKSPLRDTLISVHKDLYGKTPEVTATHGGLECANFAQKMPDCDCTVLDGPNITGLHSPDERMSLSSLNRTADFLVKVLERL